MKRIIVLCDGTGNSATRGCFELATNVKRFGDALQQKFSMDEPIDCVCNMHQKHSDSPTPDGVKCSICPTSKSVERSQITYYQSGVGTSTGMSDVSIAWQAGTGAGIDDNILEAYHFIANNYNPGDEIFIFGFSRGAFTARVVANLIIQLGLFYKNKLWMMRKAWNQYIKDDNGISFQYFKESLWKLHSQFSCTRKVTIKVLGVWDTVDSVGVPDYLEGGKVLKGKDFYMPELLYGMENVFHAIAIDEYRRTFNPTLFFLPDPATKPTDCPPINLRQCWFPGVHSNIGGSYPSEHLADITLAWMIDQCNGLLNFEPYKLQHLVTRHQHPDENKDPFHAGGDKKYPGWGCGTIYDSYMGKRTFLTWQYRCPGNYCNPKEHRGPSGVWRLPEVKLPGWVPYFGSRKPTLSEDYCTECVHPGNNMAVKGATNETIHATVFARYKASIQPRSPDEKAELLKSEKLDELNEALAKRQKEKAYAMSLLDWNPEALAAFRYEDPTQESGRYRRTFVKEVNAWKWTGRCLKTGKLFDMWEEPDVKPDTKETDKFKPPAVEMIARLKGDLTVVLPKSKQREPETEEAKKKRMQAHDFLSEDFCVPKEYKERELQRRKKGKTE